MLSLLTQKPRNLLDVALPPNANNASAKEADALVGLIKSTIEEGKTASIHHDVRVLIRKLSDLTEARQENIEPLTLALRTLLVSAGKKAPTAMDNVIAEAGNVEDASSIFKKIEAQATDPSVTGEITSLAQGIIAEIKTSRDLQLHKTLSSNILPTQVLNARFSLEYPIYTLQKIEKAANPLSSNDFVQSVKKAKEAIAEQNKLLVQAVSELVHEMEDVTTYGPAVAAHVVRAKL